VKLLKYIILIVLLMGAGFVVREVIFASPDREDTLKQRLDEAGRNVHWTVGAIALIIVIMIIIRMAILLMKSF
jgi:hypothetical protein